MSALSITLLGHQLRKLEGHLELNIKILYFMKLNEVHLEMPQSICIFLIFKIVTIATVLIILKIYIAQP